MNTPVASHRRSTSAFPLQFRNRCTTLLAGLAMVVATWSALAANILWVSDASPGSPNFGVFSGPGSNLTDQGFVKLLQDAGHNVNRFNTPDSGTTNLTAAELNAMNTNDLIIVGRAAGSGAWQNQQATNWNRDVTRPVIIMSPYLVRTDGNRTGWFGGGNGVLPDNVPTPLTPNPSGHPVVDYIFQDVSVSGTNTTELYDEAMDRNTSQIVNPPVAGALVVATATFPREDNLALITNGNAIVGFPPGTAVRGGFDILPAYRMFWAGGTRESATAPNGIPTYTGRENLTPTGEKVFLRSVEVALNNGVAPATNAGPAGVSSQPANVTVPQGGAATLTISATGAAPRLLIWQRSDGAGGFTNIPGTESVFGKSTFKIAAAGLAENGAQFLVLVSNALNVATSDVVTLTVTADTVPPVPLSAASMDGNTITVCFNEAVDTNIAAEASSYQIDGGAGPIINSIAVRPDGKSVIMVLASPIGNTALLDIFNTGDVFGNAGTDVYTLLVTNLGLTGVDIGPLNPPGTNSVCESNSFTVTGGGLDLANTIDHLRFLYRTVSGGFDARVRVTAFTGTNDHFETTAKALLTARATTATNAPAVNVFVTPVAPGDDTIASSYRAVAGGGTSALGATVRDSGLASSNAWMRIRRVANQVTTYRSTNGVDWTVLGVTNTAFSDSMNVGVGVVSHRNGKFVTATFNDFRIKLVPQPVRLTNWNAGGGNFSASFLTQAGFTYAVEYKDMFSAAQWTTLTNVAGDGALATFTDGTASATGNRFYRVSAE